MVCWNPSMLCFLAAFSLRYTSISLSYWLTYGFGDSLSTISCDLASFCIISLFYNIVDAVLGLICICTFCYSVWTYFSAKSGLSVAIWSYYSKFYSFYCKIWFYFWESNNRTEVWFSLSIISLISITFLYPLSTPYFNSLNSF